MNLVSGWNTLWGTLVPGGLQVVLSVIGVAIIAWFLLTWLWAKRKAGQGGGAVSGFPTMPFILGCLLAGPSILLPAVLAAVEGVIGIVTYLVTWVGSTL